MHREAYVAIAMPQNPGFYFGNYVLFNAPPDVESYDRWRQIFDLECAGPLVKHRSFAWPGDRGIVAPFERAGYSLETREVMECAQIAAPMRPAVGIDLRQLLSEDDWQAEANLAISNREPAFPEAGYATFARGRSLAQRHLTETGAAVFFGAFDSARLIGVSGVALAGGYLRVQNVLVDRDFRRRGVARALLAVAGRSARRTFGDWPFVVCADAHYHAKDLYCQVGFRPVGQDFALWKSSA